MVYLVSEEAKPCTLSHSLIILIETFVILVLTFIAFTILALAHVSILILVANRIERCAKMLLELSVTSTLTLSINIDLKKKT
jgi:hypothetical protein